MAAKTSTKEKTAPEPAEPKRYPTIGDLLDARFPSLTQPAPDYTAPAVWPFTVECLDGLETAREKAARAHAKALAEHDADMPGRFDRTHKYTARWQETGIPSPPVQELYGDTPGAAQDAPEAAPEPSSLETAPKVYRTLLAGARARTGTEDSPGPPPAPAGPETPQEGGTT